MDSDDSKPAPKASRPILPSEIKLSVSLAHNQMLLLRNKDIYEIKKKKNEAIEKLKNNNLDIAKAKMEKYNPFRRSNYCM